MLNSNVEVKKEGGEKVKLEKGDIVFIYGSTDEPIMKVREGERERGREGERERGREGERERGKEGKRERGKEGERERGREGKRERGKERQSKGERHLIIII